MALNRRSRPRFSLPAPWDGTFVALSDALVFATGGGLVALSDCPAVPGERLTVEMVETSRRATVRACVVDSHPVFTDGRVRHELALVIVERTRAIQGFANEPQ